MNKSELIRFTKEKNPSYTSKKIAGILDVKQGYVAHILWKAKQPNTKKADFQKAHEDLVIENNVLRKEMEKLEKEISSLKLVVKYLRAN
jgi:hypothetical protein